MDELRRSIYRFFKLAFHKARGSAFQDWFFAGGHSCAPNARERHEIFVNRGDKICHPPRCCPRRRRCGALRLNRAAPQRLVTRGNTVPCAERVGAAA